VQKRLDAVEIKLGPALGQFLIKFRGEPGLVTRHRAVEFGGITFAITGGHARKEGYCR